MPDRLGKLQVTSHRIADEVYERIGTAILDGTLAPGQRIRDADIAASLGVSRMPVREALQRLSRVGLVEMAASRYTRVTELSPGQVDAAYETLGHLMCAGLRMAVVRMDDAQREESLALLRAIGEAALRSEEDATDLYDLGGQFCRRLGGWTGNVVFSQMLDDALLTLIRGLRGQQPLRRRGSELAAALARGEQLVADGDAEGADRLIRTLFDLDARAETRYDAKKATPSPA